MGSPTCRCIEQGAECGHLPECPYFRSTPPAPADNGFMRGQEYMRRRCADVLGGQDAELIRKLPLHGDSQERCGAAGVGATETGAQGRGGAGEGPPPSASPVEGDRRDSVPVTAPAPADDAREKGLAAYDALNMREKSEIAAQDPRYCYAKGYVAALAGRADDASGADAMREACAKACRDRSRSLYDGNQMAAGLEAAKCADMIRALPLPATDDAVEEARKSSARDLAVELVKWAAPFLASKNGAIRQVGRTIHDALRQIVGRDALHALLAAEAEAIDAALRRAKGWNGG